MDLFKLLDVSSPKIIRDTLNKTVTAFNILEEYVTDTANNALSNSEAARIAAEQSLQNANNAVDTANNAEEQSRSATEIATTALGTANTASANAVNALEVSNRALLESVQAVTISNTASANANNALEKATTAVNVSDTANANASTALTNSTQAMNTANTAHQKAEEAIATANESKTESASAKGVADTAEANSISAVNTATTAANTSATAEQNALAALETAQEALRHVIGSTGTQVSVNGEAVTTFNADVKADVTYVDQKVADLIGSAPDTLDTLAELSGALRDNKDIIKVLEDAISTKANASDIMTILATKANSADVNTALTLKADASALSNYVTIDNTEQTISGTKKFTANNNTFTRTLVLGAGTPINFIGMGSGTYNTAALVCNATDKFGVECPRESDSGSAAIIPFRIGARGGQLGILQAGNIYQNGKQVANKEDIPDIPDTSNFVTINTTQKITGAKYFAGTVGNTQTEPGIYLGLDANPGAENANMAIVSANTASYIDMGRPDVDYDFRIIKWNQTDNKHAQLVYGGNASGTITIPQAFGTMALTSDLANYFPLAGGVIGANGIQWGTDSLPQDNTPQFICTIDAFAAGGRQKWASIADLKTQLGVPTNYVTTNTSQTVSGAKTFSGNVTVSGTLYIS